MLEKTSRTAVGSFNNLSEFSKSIDKSVRLLNRELFIVDLKYVLTRRMVEKLRSALAEDRNDHDQFNYFFYMFKSLTVVAYLLV